MKYATLVILITFVQGTLSLAATSAQLQELNQINACNITLEAAFKRYQYMSNTWFTNPESSYHLESNFKVLLKGHDLYFDILKEFARKHTSEANDFVELAEKIKTLDKAHYEILDRLDEIINKDHVFIASLPSLEDGLLEIITEFEHAKGLCDDSLSETIDSYIENANIFRDQITRLRLYVVEAAEKRSLLFASLLHSKKLALQKKYAEKYLKNLEEVLEKVDKTLAADRIYGEMLRFWHRATIVNGIGRGLSTRYLQYHSALIKLRADQERLHSFRQQLDSIQNISSGVKKQIFDDLNLFEGLIADEISRLEKTGWEGVFGRQKLLSNRRMEMAERLTSSCKKAISDYIEQSTYVKNVSDFREIESLYYKQISNCSGS